MWIKALGSLILIFACCLLPSAYCRLPTASAQIGIRLPPSSDTKKNRKEKPPEPTPTEPPKPQPTETPTPQPSESEEGQEVDDGDAVKVETNLVTVPVIASDQGGRYVTDLKAEEFKVSEDNAEQQVAFFATVTEPFNVVLLIDTSASTTIEKLRQVQEAAVAFTEQLREGDRVKVISFDSWVRHLSGFTSDRAALASAIRSTQPGKGTRLYDAFDAGCRALRRLKGRKAVIMLTDGVDFKSDLYTYDNNRRAVEESDIIVYPVRFDTRAETERLAREQARGGTGPVDLGGVLGRIPGMPPVPVVVNPPGGKEADASVARMLDELYRIADDYLNEMARTTGGRLVYADNPTILPRAFQEIADELRTQYSLGYYPTNAARDGKYRKIRVRTTRKGVALRTRPGYRARKSS